MKRALSLLAATLVAAVALGQQPADGTAKGTASTPHSVHKESMAVANATVESIDYATREITVSSAGGSETFTVGDEVKHLDKIHKGDTVAVKYYQGLLAEARPATAEEKANPKSSVVGAGRTMNEGKPAAGVGHQVKVVTTVTAIDKAKQSITFQGPDGHSETIHAQDPANLDKVKVGDTVVFTYTEALAISVAPAAKAKS